MGMSPTAVVDPFGRGFRCHGGEDDDARIRTRHVGDIRPARVAVRDATVGGGSGIDPPPRRPTRSIARGDDDARWGRGWLRGVRRRTCGLRPRRAVVLGQGRGVLHANEFALLFVFC